MQKKKSLSYIIQNLILIAIIIVSSLISNLTSFNQYTPLYEMTFIFFAVTTYPRAISLFWLLIYGVFRDILFAYPIGFSSLLFLSFKTIIDFREDGRESSTIWTLWFRFTVCLFIALAFQAFILSITFKYDFIKLFFVFIRRWYFTSLLYPCFHLCYSMMTKFIEKRYCDVA